MYLTLHLILAHFLADYPLQPGVLVRFKYKSFIGILLHTIIHVAVISLVCLPFINSEKVYLGLAIIFVTHLLIDCSKIACEQHFPKINKFILYVLDQVLHYLILIAVSIFLIGKIEPWLSGNWFLYYSDKTLVSFILVLVLVTYFYDVSKWALLNSLRPIPYKRDYVLMARNALIVVVAFVIYWLTR